MSENTVLVVDDNTESRSFLKFWFEINHLKVVEADNGELAVQLTKELCPQVIVMDLKMPVMNGFDAIEHIRSFYSGEQVPIVVLSAYVTDADWKRRAMEAGANEILAKPDDMSSVKKVVMKYLSSQSDQTTSGSIRGH